MDNALCRVLLVEDNEDDYVIVRDLLSDIVTTEFDLQWVNTYRTARESLSHQHYDVCLLDYRLGESNGVEIVREFADVGIPFILLTGNEDFEVDVAAAKAGTADYLIKGRINAPLLERSMRYAIERKKTEAALLQAQRFAQATVDALPSYIAVLNEHGIIVTVNAAWRSFDEAHSDANGFIGMDSGVGANYLDVCESSSVAEGREAAAGIRAVMNEERKAFCFEYPCHNPNRQCWFQVNATRFSGTGPLHIVIAHENITDHKLAEAALRASEERFQSIVASVPGMVYQFAMQPDGSLYWSFISEGCQELFGAQPETLKGQPSWLLDRLHPEDRSGFEHTLATAEESLLPWHWEGRHRTPTGKYKWIQGASRPVRLADGGTLWNGLVMDITALKEAEQQRDRFFTMSLDMLGIAGLDGYFKRLNPAFSETLGYTVEELLSRPFLDMIHQEDRAATRLAVEQLNEGASVIGFENRYLRKDGSWRWLEWKSVADVEDGLIYAAARDVTQRTESEAALRRMHDELETRVLERTKELGAVNESLRIENIQHQLTMGTLRQVAEAYREAKEEADQANAAKSEFLSRMSHELRTPLNAILGFGQILESQDLGPRSHEHVGHILQGGQHLLDLINEVLDITRVEAGKLELALEPIALAELIPEACALLRPLAAQRSIRFYENSAELGRHYILADRQRLKQVLINLLANAIKYNREGGQVHVTCTPKPDGMTAIAVQDTGRGLSAHDIAKLFTPFERLGASATGIEGTGLGLVLSRRLATAMGGTLEVESIQGRSATFIIELPQATSPEEASANQLESSAQLQGIKEAERTYSVLCIEDNLSNLKLMEAIFERRKQVIMHSATQGSIGLELAYQHKPDLILLDLNLPDMQAPEILGYLQESSITSSIPVIVISADATPAQVERLRQAGASDYMTKPFNIVQFLQTIDSYLLPK